MDKQIGLWIDHKKAVIVILENEKEEVKQIESNMEKHVRFRGGARTRNAYSPNFFKAETRMDRQFNEHLHKYYSQVISLVNGASSLYVFGSGEAKRELEKRLTSEKHQIPYLHVETADKMTDRQITAKVRKYFEH
jgi:hypothetical protein